MGVSSWTCSVTRSRRARRSRARRAWAVRLRAVKLGREERLDDVVGGVRIKCTRDGLVAPVGGDEITGRWERWESWTPAWGASAGEEGSESGDGGGLVPREGVADGGEHDPHHALGGGLGRGCLGGDVGDEFVLVHLRFRLNCARIARNGADRSSMPALGTPRNRSCEQSRGAQAWWNRSRQPCMVGSGGDVERHGAGGGGAGVASEPEVAGERRAAASAAQAIAA